MTQTNPFLEVLNKNQPPADQRKPAVDALDTFCEAIEQHWSGKLRCKSILGYPTNYGQEYRVTITSVRTGYEHTLLRAYIPINGKPIKLDLYDYSMLDCSDVESLVQTLQNFLAKPATQDTIETFASR